MIETKLYIGLNDADTLKQERETTFYIDVLKNNDTRTTFDLTYRGQVVLQP